MLTPILVLSDIGAVLITGGLGVLAAWLLRRRTTLSIRNVYPVATVAALVTAATAAARWWPGLMALSPIAAAPAAAAALAARGSRSRRGAAPVRARPPLAVAASAIQAAGRTNLCGLPG